MSNNFYQNAGRKFEQRIAKEQNTRANPGSGNKWYAPSDVPAGEFLEEVKLTGQDHYVFTLADWFILENNAMKIGASPVFIIGFFGGKEYTLMHETTWNHVLDIPENYVYNDIQRKGLTCTRIQQNVLRKNIKRIPGSPVTELLRISLAGEKFIVMPKQVFYTIKDARCQ